MRVDPTAALLRLYEGSLLKALFRLFSVCAVGSLQELMRVDPTAASAVAGWSKTVSTLLEENTFCEETIAQDASGGGGRGSAEEGKVEEEGECGEGGEGEGRAPFIASKLLALLVQPYKY